QPLKFLLGVADRDSWQKSMRCAIDGHSDSQSSRVRDRLVASLAAARRRRWLRDQLRSRLEQGREHGMTLFARLEFSIHDAVEAIGDDRRRFLRARSEIMEMVAVGRELIARSQTLLAEADRLLAKG